MTKSTSLRAPHKSLIVQKFGGSSVAQPEQIKAIAQRVRRLRDAGHAVIVVVSAMGKTTDQLLELAYKISATPNRRELDMLLSTGERVSMALMSMALNDAGCPSISFTGSQAGVLTDDSHSNARIIDMKPIRIEAELARDHVIVIAGFQGVSPLTKEITTLGRGGSDTTAVAMAAHFKAERCEILKDVDGIHSADPNLVSGARHISHLNYQQLLDMTFWGAKVLHYRSVELAALLKMPLLVALSHGEGRSTLINDEGPMFETAQILSVNSHKQVRSINVGDANNFKTTGSGSANVAHSDPTLSEAMVALQSLLQTANLPWPQILDSEKSLGGWKFLITAPSEALNAISQLPGLNAGTVNAPGSDADKIAKNLATVTATCQGSFASNLPEKITLALSQKSISIHKMLFSSMSLTAVISASDVDRATQALHDLII